MGFYDRGFFERQMGRSMASAALVAPLLTERFQVGSVVDIGCGVGGWLEAFERLGVPEIHGIDGDYVDRTLLRISPDCFRAGDLTSLRDVGRYNLALSFEVAEHLPASAAESFIDLLVSAAPVVAFSAAIPHQGGVNHVNEQWQSHWARKFAARSYRAYDVIRPTIRDDARIKPCYRQNLLVYCAEGYGPAGVEPLACASAADYVLPEFWERRNLQMRRRFTPATDLPGAARQLRHSFGAVVRLTAAAATARLGRSFGRPQLVDHSAISAK